MNNILPSINAIIWDLDHTLYGINREVKKSFNEAIAKAVIASGVDLPVEQTIKMAYASFEKFGFSGQVFINDYGLNFIDLHHKYHDFVDETVIEACQSTADLFAQIPAKHIVLTHGSASWARRVLSHIGLKPHFPNSHILALEDYDFQRKHHSPVPFQRALDILGTKPDETLMVEDTADNLAIASEIGLKTAHIHHGQPEKSDHNYIDISVPNCLTLIEALI